MTGPRTRAAVADARPVLICQGCRYGWEPDASEWSAEYLSALSSGCPECGDWLYLGEIAPIGGLMSIPRSERP